MSETECNNRDYTRVAWKKALRNEPQYKHIKRKAPGRVELLDDADLFEARKSCVVTIDAVKPTETKSDVYKRLFDQVWKWFPDLRQGVNNKNNIEWFIEKRKEILERLDKYDSDKGNSPQTTRHRHEAFAHILLSYDKYVFREYVRQFFLEGMKIQDKTNVKAKENVIKQEDLHSYVAYTDLVRMRDKQYADWVAIRDGKGTVHARKKANMYHLILALNTYIPPLRRDYAEMELWKAKEAPPHNMINYMWEKKPGQYSVILNYDKIENKRKKKLKERQVIELADEIPNVTDGKKMSQILSESFKYNPRSYVLIGVNSQDTPMTSGYDSALSAMFSPIEKNPTQNSIRRSFVNYFYKRGDVNENSIERIAHRMRHTPGIARATYIKNNFPPPLLGDDPLPVIEPMEIEMPEQKKKFFDPVGYSKQYRLDFADKIKEQRKQYYEKNKERVLRAKVLWSLNNKGTKNPRDCTAERYGIVHDKKTKRWKYKDDICEASSIKAKPSGPKRVRPTRSRVVVKEPEPVPGPVPEPVRRSSRASKPSSKVRGEGKKKKT